MTAIPNDGGEAPAQTEVPTQETEIVDAPLKQWLKDKKDVAVFVQGDGDPRKDFLGPLRWASGLCPLKHKSSTCPSRKEKGTCCFCIPGNSLGGRLHYQIAWAKLQSLVDGAEIATKELF